MPRSKNSNSIKEVYRKRQIYENGDGKVPSPKKQKVSNMTKKFHGFTAKDTPHNNNASSVTVKKKTTTTTIQFPGFSIKKEPINNNEEENKLSEFTVTKTTTTTKFPGFSIKKEPINEKEPLPPSCPSSPKFMDICKLPSNDDNKKSNSQRIEKCIDIMETYTQDTVHHESSSSRSKTVRDTLRKGAGKIAAECGSSNLLDVKVENIMDGYTDINMEEYGGGSSSSSISPVTISSSTMRRQNLKNKAEQNRVNSEKRRAKLIDISSHISRQNTVMPKHVASEPLISSFDIYAARSADGGLANEESRRVAHIKQLREKGLHILEASENISERPYIKNGGGSDDAYGKRISESIKNMYELSPRIEKMSKYSREGELSVPDPPLYTPEQFSKFLRTPDPDFGERPCVQGEKCISLKLDGPILREFLNLKDEARRRLAIEEKKPIILQECINPCVMCDRFMTTVTYLMFSSGSLKSPNHVYQHYKVSVDIEGHYNSRYCLMKDNDFTGLVAPYPSFNAAFFQQIHVIDNGNKRYKGWQEIAPLIFQ